jgi:regulator of protease activity HflC (stomatin/prohibitin superfamily)
MGKNAAFNDAGGKKDSGNFASLLLVEKPDSPLNASFLPQTLEDCEGYLKKLPLKSPNADSKIPSTVANMVNILTSSKAAANFEALEAQASSDARREGCPSAVYDYDSDVMKHERSQASSRSSHSKAPGVLGHVVKPGYISFYTINGKVFAVSEGRWWLVKDPIKAKWLYESRNVPLDQNHISAGDVHILRILPGEVGMIRAQGTEVLLDVGTHVFNSGTVSVVGKVSYADNKYFRHGRYHYLRVERGYLAKVWTVVKQNGVDTVVPRLIAQGVHYIDNHMFKFEGFVKCSEKVIQHGSVHRISVVNGHVAKIVQDSKNRILGEGDHLIESTDFEFVGFEDVTKTHVIVHGTITILRVVKGQVALAWKDNDPIFISEPGMYEFDSPDFQFDSFRDAEERLIQLGSKKIVQVQTGQVGVTYDNGTLKILYDGTHEINSPTWIVHRFLSTQEKSIRLATLSATARDKRKSSRKITGSKNFAALEKEMAQFESAGDEDLTICETKDLVKVGVRADVFYSIADPEKCILKIDTDEIEDLVRETAIATLTNIIRSTALNQIAQSRNVSAGGAAEQLQDELPGGVCVPAPVSGDAPPASAPMAEFFDKTHDEFMSKLHDDFRTRYGVDISNIRIEAFKIMDEDLAEQISKHALTTAQIENEMANLEGVSLISTQKEKTAAEVKNISALADAASLKTAADAENQRMIDAAKAEGEALRIKAMAEAEGIKLRAAAEAERAEMIAQTDLGKQEALLAIYSDMVIKSNSGVEKIVYLDPSVNKESPFALSSMHNLNQDLHALTKLGIASSNPAMTKKQ